MPYRGLLYFVSQSASSDYRSDPYATERRSLPNRTHGIRYASAPKRSTCIRTYAPSETVRPVCASSTTAASQASRSVEPQRMLKAVFAMVLVAVLSAFLGIFAAHALSAAIDDGAFPLMGSADAATADDGFSTPRSSWEQGVVVTGIDEHGELAVVDPLSRDRTSRHWTFDEIISQATGLWSYTAAA